MKGGLTLDNVEQMTASERVWWLERMEKQFKDEAYWIKKAGEEK